MQKRIDLVDKDISKIHIYNIGNKILLIAVNILKLIFPKD